MGGEFWSFAVSRSAGLGFQPIVLAGNLSGGPGGELESGD